MPFSPFASFTRYLLQVHPQTHTTMNILSIHSDMLGDFKVCLFRTSPSWSPWFSESDRLLLHSCRSRTFFSPVRPPTSWSSFIPFFRGAPTLKTSWERVTGGKNGKTLNVWKCLYSTINIVHSIRETSARHTEQG